MRHSTKTLSSGGQAGNQQAVVMLLWWPPSAPVSLPPHLIHTESYKKAALRPLCLPPLPLILRHTQRELR